MARSTVVKATNRRKSLRLRNIIEAAAPEPVESVARARLSSTSKGSASSSNESSKIPSSHDGPHRRLRRRSTDNEEEDRKPSATPPSDNTTNNTRSGKKRASSSASTQDKSKKNKTQARFAVARKPSVSTEAAPMTRHQRQLLMNQVTPSPASERASAAGALAFDFNSPVSKRRKGDTSLPRGVVDLYSSKLAAQKISCKCGEEHCSSEALSASFVHSYGKEYWQIMKDNEEPAVVPPSPVSSSSKSSSFLSPRSSCDSSIFSHETPDHRRSWVYIDTSCVEATQPKESTKFLHYQPELTPKMRSILVDWVIELSEHFHFGPSALHLAITLVDKVLACGPLSMDDEDWSDDHDYDEIDSNTNCFLISRERFQLLGAACTWLACKMEELSPPSVSEIAYVSDNIYTTEQIKRMERRICKALDFALVHQTPYPYLFEFIRASEECPSPCCHSACSSVFQNLVNYLLELGRLPYGPVTKKPSLLAASAVYLARVTLDVQSSDTSFDSQGRWTRTLKFYTGYSKEDLEDTVKAIHSYQMGAEESSLKSVFTKYKHKKYGRVALKTVPLAGNLGF
jgi:cyclin A